MSNYTITADYELMQNYLQADSLDPEDAFCALQSSAGSSLLFSIGTDKTFYVTKESPGDAYGWVRADLSSAQIKKDYPTGATASTFAAAQCAYGGGTAAIHLAMVLNAGGADHLYLSLGNSDADTSWTDSPAWTGCPFNAVDSSGNTLPAPAPLKILSVYLSEAADKEYIVVDVARDPTSPILVVSRYYIDVSTPASPVWRPHDLAIDLEAQGYMTCLGRCAPAGTIERGHPIDGLYTGGTIGGQPQLIYTPLYNLFDPTAPPSPSRLQLTSDGKLVPDAIAACRNPDNTSDLYASAGGVLYYFASDNQKDGAVAVVVAVNALFGKVRSLFASVTNGVVTVWGMNSSDQIFYTTCPVGQLTASPGAWTFPLPILSGVEQVSPYVNRAYDANSFFAHTGQDKLTRAVKSPGSTLWSFRDITLPPLAPTTPAQKFSSYTTRILVTDASNQPAANVSVTITASSVTSVYINHLYYVLSATPVQIATDALGAITIVECVNTLAGTRLTVTIDQQTLAINPMDKAFQKATSLTTSTALQGATITYDDGTTKPLVAPGTSGDTLAQLATGNQQLSKAYASVASAPRPSSSFGAPRAMALASAAASGDSILVDIGDFFCWLGSEIESGAEQLIQLVEDVASGIWTFIATIAGQAYHAVLDVVEKVVAAAEWLYDVVKTAVEDLLKFLEFLFGWQDILVTHRVMKNVFTQYAQYAIDSLTQRKTDIATIFKELQGDVDKWANIPDFDQTPDGTLQSNPTLAGQNSAPANLGAHHFQGNVGSASSVLSIVGPPDAIFQDLMNLLSAEQATLVGAYNAIQTDIIDQFNQLSVTTIIKKFLAIVVDTLLQTAENILLAVVDVFIQLMSGMMAVLTTPLDIPVLSWLYQYLVGDALSFLDLICLLGAIPTTLLFKIAGGAAPFPAEDAFTTGLLGAASFSAVQALFVTTSPSPRALTTPSALALPMSPAAGDSPVLNDARLKTFGFVTGVFALAGSVVLIYTSAVQRTLEIIGLDNARPKTLATISCIGNIAYVSPNIATFINAKTDNWYQQLNNVLTGISLVKGFANIPLAINTNKAVALISPAVESLINLVWNVPVIMNIIDNKDRWNTDYKSLIPESIGNFAFNLGGILELPITLIKDPKAKIITVLVQDAFMLTYGLCMPIAGGIYQWAPGQNHDS